ncbi:aminobenzoate oxygenase [Burkholderia ubonensis]|uniref:diiron oxygenase n=1 Tax=Burkholderia ubonensis TaxID=101571 RepID=UPI000759CF1A|nr:diiron oxygenase [Burkholderia ubonensis]KUZ69176.1 aminobenzoate oxygenase [Burkholderia ubonensis]
MQQQAIDSMSVHETLTRLSALWKKRAAVNNAQLEYSDLEFDSRKADFCESLLPFRNHAVWHEAPEHIRSKCLSYAWAIYNLKTVYIECDIVTPACEDLIKYPPSASRNKFVLQDVMSEALLDEALHTRMSISACNYIYAMRDLKPLEFLDFNLISWRRGILQDCTAEWQRRLARFAIACASETLITDYLKAMSEDDSIQSICHLVTKTHAMDEWSHSSVFSYAATDIVHLLTPSEREYLKYLIPKTVEMFANNEMGAWEAVFKLVGLPNHEAILADSSSLGEVNVYMDSVNALQQRIGLVN